MKLPVCNSTAAKQSDSGMHPDRNRYWGRLYGCHHRLRYISNISVGWNRQNCGIKLKKIMGWLIASIEMINVRLIVSDARTGYMFRWLVVFAVDMASGTLGDTICVLSAALVRSGIQQQKDVPAPSCMPSMWVLWWIPGNTRHSEQMVAMLPQSTMWSKNIL